MGNNQAVQLVDSRSLGLCMTCNNSQTCFYRSNRGFDAVYCEMFDNTTAITAGTVQSKNQQSEIRNNTIAGNKVRGLCMNCEKLAGCAFIKPDSGVWHCEEYE